jgi:MFS family permease
MALQSVLPAIGREFRLSDTLVTGAFAISALMWTVASPFWARLSDSLGRKRVMMIGLAGFVVSMTGFGLAATSGLEHWLGAGLAFILMGVARTIYGVFGSAAPIASQAYVADRTSPEQRTQAMSLLASAQGLGTVIGPALAPFFVLPFIGLAGPMYAFALLGLVVLFVVWRRLPSGEVVRIPSPSGHRGDAGKGLWKDPRVRGYLLYGLFVTGAQAANIAVLGFHIIDELALTGIAAREAQPFIGIAMLAGAAATLMAQWGLIPLLRLQPADLMRWGAALALVGNLMSLAPPGFYGVVVGYAVVSMGIGFARPGFTAGSSLSVGPHEQGAIAGLMMSLGGLSFTLHRQRHPAGRRDRPVFHQSAPARRSSGPARPGRDALARDAARVATGTRRQPLTVRSGVRPFPGPKAVADRGHGHRPYRAPHRRARHP